MIPFHPLADIFPLIEGEDFDQLVTDVREHGIREPITLLHGKILDGRNRYRAGVIARMLPESLDEMTITQLKSFKHYLPPGAAEPSHEEILAFVLSRNLHRRHMNESQRAMVAARIANMPPHRPGDKSANLHTSQEDAARRLNVSTRSVASAKAVEDNAVPELKAAVDRGHMAVSVAAKATTLPVDEQRKIAEKANAGEENAARNHIKKTVRDKKEKDLGEKQAAFPNKKFGVILADPEWKFETWSEEGMDRAADNHYPTSVTDAICARPVQDIAADDCVLFLWATAPMLPDALRVMAAWGFSYKSHCVWAKDKIGTGYWFRNQHEILLVGTRGENLPAPAMGTQVESLVDASVGRHSEKPARFYEIIETYFPTLPKIELNARCLREGWTPWGNEAPPASETEAA